MVHTAPGKALFCALTTWFLDMERAFLRSDSVVPEEAEGGPPPTPAAPSLVGGDDPGGALMVTETWMLILSAGSTLAAAAVEGASELGLEEGEEDGDPAAGQASLSLAQKSTAKKQPFKRFSDVKFKIAHRLL